MYLALLETARTPASPSSAASPATGWADLEPVLATGRATRLYETNAGDQDRLLWCEFTSQPELAAPADTRMTVLQQKQLVGAAGEIATPWVYLVHTDIAPDLLDEYDAWYGEEHLPRLVKAPGILRARRFTSLVGAPRFLTAYDLTDRDAFESPQALVARKTPWTERMRSQFTNTRRIMCRLIDG